MGYHIKTILSNRNNYGNKRKREEIQYLVYHYTSNKGDRAKNNGLYFANNVVKASAHYFVDDIEVVQSVPENYIAYAVGGRKYTDSNQTGGGKLYGKVTNKNSISIELCGDQEGNASEKTKENGIELGKKLMKKYHIPSTRVIRHFDVTGKKCPAYFCCTEENEENWKKFKTKLSENIYSSSVKKSYRVKIEVDVLNIRESASINSPIVGTVKKGEVYTIIKKQGDFGRLKSKVGWIFLKYTKVLGNSNSAQ